MNSYRLNCPVRFRDISVISKEDDWILENKISFLRIDCDDSYFDSGVHNLRCYTGGNTYPCVLVPLAGRFLSDVAALPRLRRCGGRLSPYLTTRPVQRHGACRKVGHHASRFALASPCGSASFFCDSLQKSRLTFVDQPVNFR